MASSRIIQALESAFKNYRIVFWDDDKEKLIDEFETLELPDVTKIKINNNEFSVKYRILVEEPDKKFLIYRPAGEPEVKDNWLLDVQLASYKFVAEQDTLRCTEIGLDPAKFSSYIKQHENFFNKKEYREKLAAAIKGSSEEETIESVDLKIIGIMSPLRKVDTFYSILQSLLKDAYELSQNGLMMPQDACLEMQTELLSLLAKHFNYQSTSLSLHDFALKIFSDSLKKQLGEPSELSNEVSMFLGNWQDSKNYGENFNEWTEKAANELNLQLTFDKLDFDTLKQIDYFRNIDEMILEKLRSDINDDLVNDIDVRRILDIRCTKTWWKEFSNYYETAYAAAKFKQLIKTVNLNIENIEDAVSKYQSSWYEVDQEYRKFNFYCRNNKNNEPFSDIKVIIDNLYTNDFLRPLGQKFSIAIQEEKKWGKFNKITYQPKFFNNYVEPFFRKNNKVVVIISDALRYELGDDLTKQINKNNRFSASIEPMVSVLPSYTQLGMAALLPNKSIELKADNTAAVNGISATGIENRKKILAQCGRSSTCINAEELLSSKYKNKDIKELIASNEIVYVYHDVIDTTGEHDEEHLFDKSQDCLEELMQLVTRLSSGNANNIIITADHGFVYQDIKLDKNVDFLDEPFVTGEKYQVDRRFITINGELDASNTDFHSFTAKDLSISGELSVLIPKAIQRIRKQGLNGRYIHGGATLEETIIPVIHVNKKRKDDVSEVKVKVISRERIITSGQILITFYQEQPVKDKVKGISIKAGFYRDGKPVSNIEDLEFNKETTNVEEREQKRQFKLSTGIDSGTIILKLFKRVENTDQYAPYDEIMFSIRQNLFGRDF